jgi:hypothetical protein
VAACGTRAAARDAPGWPRPRICISTASPMTAI